MKKSRFKAVLISVLLIAFCISGEVIAQGPPDPTISSIVPNRGKNGDWVIINGTNFRATPNVWFYYDDWPSQNVQFISSTRLRVLVPLIEWPRFQGPVDVQVENPWPWGESNILSNGFTYLAPPYNFEIGGDQSADEGDTVTVSAIFDDNSGDTHDAEIDWDDGTVEDVVVNYIFVGESTIPTVTGSHVYEDDDTYTVTITATDQYGASDSDSLIVNVDNEPPVLRKLSDQTITGANPTVSVNVQFTDPGILDTHTMRVVWGDGSNPDIIQPAVSPVTIQHTYPGDGTIYEVEVTVVDDDGGGDVEFFTVTNIAPVLPDIDDVVLSEGTPTVLLDVMFTDTSPGDTHTITIDWGDNSTPDIIFPVSSPVTTGHTYPGDDGQYTVNVTVRDIEGIGSETSLTVLVVNEDPIIAPIGNQIIGGCDPTFSFSANFTDPGIEDTHTAVIDWGDGIQEVGQVAEQVISGVLVGIVTGTHTYASDESINNVTITVTDDDGGSSSESFSLIVRTENPVIDDLPDLIVSECDPTVNLAANFTDCSSLHIYRATINWGDGTETVGKVSEVVIRGTLIGKVTGSHTYAKDDGIYPVTVTVVVDDDERSDFESFNVIVRNESPVITDDLPDLNISECDSTVNFEANFSDCSPADRHTAIIDWGDGTQMAAEVTEVVVAGVTLGTIAGSHTYPRKDGKYAVIVTVEDEDDGIDSATFTVVVENDSPVIVTELPDLIVSECEPTIDLQVAFFDCGDLDTHRTDIDWGDGTSLTTGTVTRTVVENGILGTITATHFYTGDDATGENIYTVTITVQDGDGGSDSQSFTVTVENEAPVIETELVSLTLRECDPTLELQIDFTDCGQRDTHTVEVVWGDGTSSQGDVSETVISGRILGTITGSHTYIGDDNTYSVTVTLQDDDGGSDSQSFSVTVENDDPVVEAELQDLVLLECDPSANIQVAFIDCSFLDIHTATIDWGDETQTVGTVNETVVPGGVSGIVTGGHTYVQDDSVHIVTVTVEDDDGGSSSGSFSVTVVNDPPVILTETQDFTFSECEPTVDLQFAFIDCSPLDIHTGTIVWGDGTQTAGTVSETVVPDGVSGTVSGSHTYTRGGPTDPETYSITVILEDDDGGESSGAFTAVVVEEGPAIETGLPDLTLSECDPTASLRVNFTNCNPRDTHIARIDWGDGTQTPGDVTEAVASGAVSGTVTSSHTYAQDGNIYTVTVTIQDSGGESSSTSFTVTVEDEGTVVGASPEDLTLLECEPTVDLRLEFTNCNPLDTHTVVMDWGDGTQTPGDVSEEVISGAVSGTVTGSHTYAGDDGQYEVTVTIQDDDGESHSESLTVTVENERPVIETELQSLTLTECNPALDIQVNFRDCSLLDTHTAVIAWGDGTETAGTVIETVVPDGVSGTITGSHTYAGDDGNYTVLVTVEDDDGGKRSSSFDVTVENERPVIETQSQNFTIAECDPTLNIQVDFNDCGLDTHTAAIDWGDGTQTPGTVSETVVPDGVSGTVVGSHVYAEDDDNYTVTVTVEDDDGGNRSRSFDVTVENEAPVIETSLQDLTLTECDPTIDVQMDFTSCNFQDTHIATIDWGDGTQTEGTVSETVVSDSVSGTVTGSHTYIEDDNVYTVTVTVEDDDGGSSSASFIVTVENEGPTIQTETQEIIFPECDPTVEVQWDFVDCSSQDTHTAVIIWGDGTETAGILSEAVVSGDVSGTVTGSHTYTRGVPEEPETYTITVTVEDDDGGSHSTVFTAIAEDEIPIIETSLPDLTLTEDDTTVDIQVVFSDCNPLSTHTVVIGWGDNTEDTIDPAVSPITGSHTYSRDDGAYVVVVAVIDNNGVEVGESFSVAIGNVDPVVDAGADQTLDADDPAVINASFTDGGLLDTHTATINWGDGTTGPGQVNETNGSGTVTGSHTYADVGAYDVTVTVTDDDGGSGSDSISVGFVPAPAVTSISPNQVIAAGGTRVTIGGRNFQNGATVRIGNASATGVTFVSSTSITATTPPGSVGTVDVSVTNPDGQQGTLASGLTYTGIARISISPQTAVVETGQTQQFSVSGTDPVGNPYPVDNTDVDWSVADASIGDINSSGLFTAANFGSTIVTAALRSDSSVLGQADVRVPDTDPPEVLSEELFPELQDENVPVTSGISILFSEPIDIGSVEGGGIEITGEDDREIEGDFTFDPTAGSLIFTPDEPFRDEEAIAVIVTAAVEDLAGNSLQRAFRLDFTTGRSVWAGDANNDGIVDIRDIIPLGQYWEETGPSREEATAEWGIQPAVAWDPNVAATYADTNGDGRVDQEDILPIAANWRLSHDLNQLAPPQTTGERSVPDDPKLLNVYEAMYEVLENAPFENDGVQALKSALRELVININRQSLPHESRLLQNFPNPFNPETWIPYQLAEDASVRISIYHVNGALVQTLEIGQRPAGYYLSKEYAAYWDGKNNAGEQVSSGVYFGHFQAGNSESVIKLIITR